MINKLDINDLRQELKDKNLIIEQMKISLCKLEELQWC